MTTPLIEVRNVTRTFGAFKAVNDVSFDVPRGNLGEIPQTRIAPWPPIDRRAGSEE